MKLKKTYYEDLFVKDYQAYLAQQSEFGKRLEAMLPERIAFVAKTRAYTDFIEVSVSEGTRLLDTEKFKMNLSLYEQNESLKNLGPAFKALMSKSALSKEDILLIEACAKAIANEDLAKVA